MSRDSRGNRTEEVDGSSPFSSTNSFNHFGANSRSHLEMGVPSFASGSCKSPYDFSMSYAKFL